MFVCVLLLFHFLYYSVWGSYPGLSFDCPHVCHLCLALCHLRLLVSAPPPPPYKLHLPAGLCQTKAWFCGGGGVCGGIDIILGAVLKSPHFTSSQICVSALTLSWRLDPAFCQGQWLKQNILVSEWFCNKVNPVGAQHCFLGLSFPTKRFDFIQSSGAESEASCEYQPGFFQKRARSWPSGSCVKILPRSHGSPPVLLPLGTWKLRGYGKKHLQTPPRIMGTFLENVNSLRKGLAVAETGCVHAAVKLRKWKAFHHHIYRDAEEGGHIYIFFTALLNDSAIWGVIFSFPQRWEGKLKT